MKESLDTKQILELLTTIDATAAKNAFDDAILHALRRTFPKLKGESSKNMIVLIKAVNDANDELRRVRAIVAREKKSIMLDIKRQEAIEFDRLEMERLKNNEQS